MRQGIVVQGQLLLGQWHVTTTADYAAEAGNNTFHQTTWSQSTSAWNRAYMNSRMDVYPGQKQLSAFSKACSCYNYLVVHHHGLP